MTPLCPAAAIQTGHPVLVRTSATATAILLRTGGGELLAYHNACPHMGIELDWEPRRLMTPSGRYLRCTGHGALFEPATGVCVRGPCVNETLTKLSIHLEDEMVVLDG
jgi:nitrite reductase/ring-hydroxylating ferredoxin subunit